MTCTKTDLFCHSLVFLAPEPASLARNKRSLDVQGMDEMQKVQAVLYNLNLPTEIEAVIEEIEVAKAEGVDLPTNIDDVIAALLEVIAQLRISVGLAHVTLPEDMPLHVDDVITALEATKANLSEEAQPQVADIITALQQIK